MASTTRDPDVAQGLRDLRGELSRVVADLRLSIFDLRSDVSATNGLGSALSDYVRQVGAKSDLTVHLTLNEAPTRLSPEVEAELLRIAQEAITNARKHASRAQPVGGLLDRPAARQPHHPRRRAGHHGPPGRLLRHLDHARAGPAHRRHVWKSPASPTDDKPRGTVVQVKVAEKSFLTDSKVCSPMSEAPTRVLLIDDHDLIRQGLARAFERHDDFEVAGQAASVAEGLRLFAPSTPTW